MELQVIDLLSNEIEIMNEAIEFLLLVETQIGFRTELYEQLPHVAE